MASFVAGSASTVISTTSASGANTGAYTAGAGSNRVVVVAITAEQQTTPNTQDVSAITLGGNALTKIGEQHAGASAGYLEDVYLYYLKEADIQSGSQTLSVTMVHDGNDLMCQVFTLADIDQTTSIGTPVGSSAGSATAEQSFTTTASDSILVTVCGHTASSSGVWTPATSSGTNVEILDAQTGSGSAGFTMCTDYMVPGSIATFTAGATCAANNGTAAGMMMLTVEFFNGTGGGPTANPKNPFGLVFTGPFGGPI